MLKSNRHSTRLAYQMAIAVIIMLLGISCGGGDSTGKSRFVGEFTQASPDYIAKAPGCFDWLEALFSPIEALALPDLSIREGAFTGPYPVPENTEIYILGSGGETIATGKTSFIGKVIIDNVPEGYLTVRIIGGDGMTWSAPTHIGSGHNAYMRAVMKNNPDGIKSVYAKSVHNDTGQGTNIDDFSIAIYGRPHSSHILSGRCCPPRAVGRSESAP